MYSLLSSVGGIFKSMNPSMVDSLPSGEISDSDICILGPNGETDEGIAVKCIDLDSGYISAIGSWSIPPEQHAFDFLLIVSCCIPLWFYVYKSLPKCDDANNDSRRLPLFLRIVGAFFFGLMFLYKAFSYKGSSWFLLMPCNVGWFIVGALVFFSRNESKPDKYIDTEHCQLQLYVSKCTSDSRHSRFDSAI